MDSKRSRQYAIYIFREKPFLLELTELKCSIWVYEDSCGKCVSWRNLGERIDSDQFPEVTFENSPKELELRIKK